MGDGSTSIHSAQDIVLACQGWRHSCCYTEAGGVAEVERMGGQCGDEEGSPGNERKIQEQQKQSGLSGDC